MHGPHSINGHASRDLLDALEAPREIAGRATRSPGTGRADLIQMANVLIVDDQVDTVELTAALVESAGHRAQTAINGAEGLEALAAGPLPDGIILDVEMPVLGGPGMAHQMLLHDAGQEKIPIVLVSAREDLAEIAKRVGTPYFLAKATPDYGRALLEILGRALRERAAPAAA